MFYFNQIDIGKKFLNVREEHGNSCIYKKIIPRIVALGEPVRNAVRCWKKMSEFVTFHEGDKVSRIIE